MICEMVQILQPVGASSIRFQEIIGDKKIEYYSNYVEEVIQHVGEHVVPPTKRQFLFYLGEIWPCNCIDVCLQL